MRARRPTREPADSGAATRRADLRCEPVERIAQSLNRDRRVQDYYATGLLRSAVDERFVVARQQDHWHVRGVGLDDAQPAERRNGVSATVDDSGDFVNRLVVDGRVAEAAEPHRQ